MKFERTQYAPSGNNTESANSISHGASCAGDCVELAGSLVFFGVLVFAVPSVGSDLIHETTWVSSVRRYESRWQAKAPTIWPWGIGWTTVMLSRRRAN